MFKFFVSILVLFSTAGLFSKTLVFTTAFNRPDFIELQSKLFNKFLMDEYEFWVISDAPDFKMRKKIENKCKELKITCINVPQEIHSRPYLPRLSFEEYYRPNTRHCNAAQWAWDHYFVHHDGPVMIIDSDMFLIRPFSVEQTLSNKHLAGVFWGTEDSITKKGYSYLWLALILFNNPILPERETISFNCGTLPLPGANIVMDSGGWTYFYLDKFKELLNIHNINYLQGYQFYCPYRYASPKDQNFDSISKETIVVDLKNRGFSQNEIELVLEKPYTIELLGNNHFLHYRSGTNYENYSGSFLKKKDEILMSFFEKILK